MFSLKRMGTSLSHWPMCFDSSNSVPLRFLTHLRKLAGAKSYLLRCSFSNPNWEGTFPSWLISKDIFERDWNDQVETKLSEVWAKVENLLLEVDPGVLFFFFKGCDVFFLIVKRPHLLKTSKFVCVCLDIFNLAKTVGVLLDPDPVKTFLFLGRYYEPDHIYIYIYIYICVCVCACVWFRLSPQ